MSEFIDIDKEDGELIMKNMETALGFRGWTLLGAKYDERRQCIRALFSHEQDTDVHHFSLKMEKTGKLIAYANRHFPPGVFIQYFNTRKTGFVLTACEERLKRVFERVMTPELALKLIEVGMLFVLDSLSSGNVTDSQFREFIMGLAEYDKSGTFPASRPRGAG